MNIKYLTLCLLLTGIITTVFAQESVDTAIIKKIRNEGLNKSKVMETAFYLTDVSGSRLSGSPGLKRAQDWSVSQL
ncbi:MAG: peptidase M28, partial [Sphingobacteriales bacterium]